jgi:dihydroxy-acid dehydratase
VIDAELGTIELMVEAAELERRRGEFVLLPPRYTTGVLAKYAKLATGADRGAITEA